ncbi:DUF6709 family protein [uncultured Clostridium sp.]|uniref:DUF6709 family protein n=1 Tax=uncultured Clostridium sp. TaxID=59620 RepID=UPI0028E780DA|nr:DUF6709 family protein [uncultured Clostridium sp.]
MKKASFMKAYKKRWTYRIMALALCAVAALLAIGIGIYTYYENTNNPTVVKNLEEYYEALNNDSYIQVSSDELYDLNIVITESTSKLGVKISEDVKSRFVAMKLDPYVLTIAVPNKQYEKFVEQEKGPFILKGTLIEFEDSELETIQEAIIDNNSLSDGLPLASYFQYLQYESPMNSASFFFMIAACFIIYILIMYMVYMRKNTVALKSLKNFSNGNLEVACQKIDGELNSDNVYKNGPITITKNYIVVETQQITFALPLKELMWVYKQTIKKKVYGIIPAGKTNGLVCVFSDKNEYKVDLFKGEKIIDEVIEYISNNCKASFVGHSEELENLLKKDSDEFIFKWRVNKESSKNMDI